jgi:hypothetical protein
MWQTLSHQELSNLPVPGVESVLSLVDSLECSVVCKVGLPNYFPE